MSLNKVLLLGALTRDPEVRYSPKGTAYAHIGIAVTTSYQHNGERKEEVAFVDVTLFGKLAEKVAEGCKKGTPLFVEGRLKLETWEDKQTHQKRSKLSVMAESCRLAQPAAGGESLPPRNKPATAAGKPSTPPPSAPPDDPADTPPPMEDDSVPF